ncbi:FHA domain-containing protein [Elongatibacter sediminis]|uniref:FHA domain-containing protein n=1 Tax=Elongatibacter sediminis TaxID=3119006 RepID=A0AAW9R4J6_9GAMM
MRPFHDLPAGPVHCGRQEFSGGARSGIRAAGPYLFCVLAWLLVAGSVCAQAPVESGPDLPDWAVLVLKPVGDKRVRPVTGVVVSPRGQVIVPAGFAAPGDVLFVLDGGADIFEHGRTATVADVHPASGIALLDVDGLERAPVRLAAGSVADETRLHLVAFPPAERIAEGDSVIRRTTSAGALARTASGSDTGSADATSAAGSGLPNVTGPLLDDCGGLAAYSMAGELAGMAASPDTSYLPADRLARALASLGVATRAAPCGVDGDAAAEAAAGDSAALNSPETQDMAPARETSTQAPADGLSSAAGEADGVRLPWWGLLLAALLIVAVYLSRRRSARTSAAPGLLDDGVVAEGRPVRAADVREDAGAPASGWRLHVVGTLPGGAAFERRCSVNPAAIDVLIGSGDADIRIEGTGIAAHHARLGGSVGALTLTDLGSAGGTWIGRVPCTRGEIMFVTEADTLAVAEATFTVRLAGAAGAGDDSNADPSPDSKADSKPAADDNAS